MKTSTKKAILKKRGRPATGNAPSRTFRLTDEFIANLDAWASKQVDQPGRSEAIRRLVELGLTVKTRATASKPGRMMRAQELAAEAIDRIIDPAAHPEEHAQRRRRLTKGPEEFQEVRVDRAKGK
jgi:hypothetical protein